MILLNIYFTKDLLQLKIQIYPNIKDCSSRGRGMQILALYFTAFY